MKRTLFPLLLATSAAVLGFFAHRAIASTPTVEPVMSFTGRLTNNGAPIPDADENVVVRFFDDPTAGALVCRSNAAASPVRVTDGRFRLPVADCPAQLGANGNLWAQVEWGGITFPRTKVGAVPYAIEAKHADSATHATTVTAWNGPRSR